jgi:hypothetical protein
VSLGLGEAVSNLADMMQRKEAVSLAFAIGEAFKGSMWPTKPIELDEGLWLFLSGSEQHMPMFVITTPGGVLEFVRKKKACPTCGRTSP